jgi:hypothetical protein
MRRLWVWVAGIQTFSGGAWAQSAAPASPPVATQQQVETEPPHPWRSRPFAFDAVLGIATPWGLTGLAAEYAPIEHLSVGGGIGTNLLGWQLASMARVRFTPQLPSSCYFGAGYSQGRHSQSESTRDGVFSLFVGPLTAMGHDSKRGHDWRIARWVNAELGIERRERRGFDVRGFVGGAFLLNPSAGVPARSYDDRSTLLPTRDFMLYAGTALGFSI